MNSEWLVASNNRYKTEDLMMALAFYGLNTQPYQTVMAPLNFPSEKTTSYLANATQKARFIAEKTVAGVIADDSGLVLAALGEQALGITTNRTLKQRGGRSQNQVILAALADQKNRSATMICTLVAVTARRRVVAASGEVHGYIAQTPAGGFSHGFDRLFQLEPGGPTLAEMPAESRIPLTHRGQAAKQLVAQLEQEDE